MKVAERCEHCQNECKLTVTGGGILEICPEFKPQGNHRFPTWYRFFDIPESNKRKKVDVQEILEGVRKRGVRKVARLLGVNHSLVGKWLKLQRIPEKYVGQLQTIGI